MSKTISIVIVNYNVKDLLKLCIESIQRSVFEGHFKIIVVDNDSKDGSVKLLKDQFPDVKFIQNSENLGFSKANNIGFKEATGDYILILNPDTEIEPDTLQKMYELMEGDPKIGAAGCKVLNQDGSFQLACRRSFPTPWNSFCKLFGLQNLFPKSKIFSGYNLTYKSIEKEYEVDALIGAFIFCRNEVIKKTGGFDQDFFMYGEDLDFCYRIKKFGWKIIYSPRTKIIHTKGESTKRSNIDDVKHFYDAMKIYVRKNYKYSNFFISFLNFGIKSREFLAYISKYKFDFLLILIDAVFLNLAFLIANYLRFGTMFGYPAENFLFYVAIISVMNVFSNFSVGSYFEKNYSLKRLFQAILTFGISTGFITYLSQDFDLSRKVLFLTGAFYFIFGGIFRVILERKRRKLHSSNVIIIGEGEISNSIFNYLKNNRISGVSNVEIFEPPSGANFSYLEKIIKDSSIKEVILAGNKFRIEDLRSNLKQRTLETVNIYNPKTFEDFQTRTLLEKAFGKQIQEKSKLEFPRYRFFKRALDIFISTFFLTLGLPLVSLIKDSKKSQISALLKVLSGKWSFIGIKDKNTEDSFKEGFLTLADISGGKSRATIKNLNNYYLKNFSFGLDLEIFFRSFGKKG